jgi:hypothetical protein
MAEPITVRLAALPASLQEFNTLHADLATTPEGGAAALVAALVLYAGDAELGERCLGAALDPARLVQGAEGRQLGPRDLALIRRQFAQSPYLAASYVRGATPQNGYALPKLPWQIACTTNPYSGNRDEGPFKVFVACSGAASPRPVSLRRDSEGRWRPYEWSSLLVGIRAPGL